ncbi:hypothetical protein MMC12_002279 [Toensbergia leucococca]|nr:hypothetical protein [Toensbergia leucococca]
MPHASRDKALQDFRDSDTAVMIASLKCGGVGLNLTAASRVIYIDLWWNSSVEQQAFCRVFRIGQVSETYITRFVVKDTVDERIQSLQKSKETLIAAAMGDNGKRESKLTVRELMRLFGPVQEDEDHRPFIIVDEEDEAEEDAAPVVEG